jgi:dATP pyrophosphohydrolase
MDNNELPVRCGAVAVVVLRGTGAGAQVLLLKRAKGVLAGLWSQVTGSLEADETAPRAALREVIEETGLQPRRLYTADFCDHFYDPASDGVEVVPMFVALVADDAEVSPTSPIRAASVEFLRSK